MAVAVKNVKIVETVESVTLTLSEDEAQGLLALTGRTDSSAVTGGIYDALYAAGITRRAYSVKHRGAFGERAVVGTLYLEKR